MSSRPFHFAYQGALSSCFYTGHGAADGGTISAGKQITIDGHRYQEPVPTGSGSCVVTQAAGHDFAFWNNGTQTIVKYETTSGGGITHITGQVVPSLTLDAVDPKPGDPRSITFNTTNFNGQTVFGVMQFTADPLLCGTPEGLSAATISGQLGHYGPETQATAASLKCSATPDGEVCTSPGYGSPKSTRANAQKREPAAAPPAMRLTSPAFSDGGAMPRRYTCLGNMTSPPLTWTDAPAGTRELELLVTDASRDNLSHWVVYAIPPADTSSPEGSAPAGARQGNNEFGLQGYLPPCPIMNSGVPHKYVFELFASRRPLTLPEHPTDAQVRAALKDNVLATATLMGTYKLGD
jgi:Raf kinase inhibitor-like YbhB/YbcL family protein